MERDYSGELLRFIQEHPSVYHVIEGQRRILLEAGYTNSCWRVSTGRSGREESISSPETTRRSSHFRSPKSVSAVLC